MNTIAQARSRTAAEAVAEYRRHAKIYRRNGGHEFFQGEPETPEQAASWEARVAMWCIWYQLRQERGRVALADALRAEHWALYVIDGARQDVAEGREVDPGAIAEVAELRAARMVVTAELIKE